MISTSAEKLRFDGHVLKPPDARAAGANNREARKAK
jgi:hypothetical protein